MADINVQRRGPHLWVWILGVLLLALLIWGVAALLDDEPEVEHLPIAPEQGAPAGAAP